MGAGNLGLEGLDTIFDGHWRLMEKRGLCVVTRTADATNTKSVIADQSEEKALRLVEVAKRAKATAEAALVEAQKLRKLADESEGDTKKRIAADRKIAAENRKKADEEAKRKEKSEREENKKAVADAAKAIKGDEKKGGGKK